MERGVWFMKIKKRYYTWKDFDKDVNTITKQLELKYFDRIYAPPRGGLVLGVRLSHLLNLPLHFDKKHISKYTLIVDEIVDTGKTLEQYKNHYIACLHWKHKTASFRPNVFCRKTSEWIVYPWEK